MGIGVGIVLLLAGAIIYWAVNFDVGFLNESVLGIILMVGGLLAIVLTLVLNAHNIRRRDTQDPRYCDR